MSVHQTRWPIGSHSTLSPSVLPTSTTWTSVARTVFMRMAGLAERAPEVHGRRSSGRIRERLDDNAPGNEENVRDKLQGTRIDLGALVCHQVCKAPVNRPVFTRQRVLFHGHGRTVFAEPAAARAEL